MLLECSSEHHRFAMPSRRPSANPFRNPRLDEKAASGLLMIMRCNLCGKVVRFWAADLVKVLGPHHQAHVPPFPCSRCRTRDYIDLRWTMPSATELAEGLTVRRPVRQVVRWKWRDEKA